LLLEIATDLLRTDEVRYWRWQHRRSRGRNLPCHNGPLGTGTGAEVAVLFLDVSKYADFVRSEDPGTVMQTLNQIFADLAPILAAQEVQVNPYLSDGFMAVARGRRGPQSAVAAGLQLLAAVREFNRPRVVLRWPELQVRVGVATGYAHLGNVGTAGKVDFTAVGATTNLAARLMTDARRDAVCICDKTAERVGAEFADKHVTPRHADLKGFGMQTVWDVSSAK